MTKNFFSQPAHGFTLIETIVSITLLVTALTGPMALARQSLHASRDARLELEATHLAEEGIELMHSVRDNNSATGNPWLNNIACPTNRGCVVNVSFDSSSGWDARTVGQCAPPVGATLCATEAPLYKKGGIYKQDIARADWPPAQSDGWVQSDFSRVITVEDVVPGREVEVKSTVTFSSGRGVSQTIVATEHLYNWFPNLSH